MNIEHIDFCLYTNSKESFDFDQQQRKLEKKIRILLTLCMKGWSEYTVSTNHAVPPRGGVTTMYEPLEFPPPTLGILLSPPPE